MSSMHWLRPTEAVDDPLAPCAAVLQALASFLLAHALVDDSDLFLRYERRIDA